jgi:hypothetical protein
MCGAFAPDNPQDSALFDLAMRENSKGIARQMLSAYDFTQFGHIVDVGGGDGTLIAGLLAACGQATGTLLDLAHVVSGAVEVLEQADVRGRCKVVAGSFFERVPAGGDVYVLKSILHDWDDPEAHTIVRNCREAMHRGARLLVVERMLALPDQGAEGKLSDLNMLVNAGGRERTSDELTGLLADAGFELRAVTRLPSSRFVMRQHQAQHCERRLIGANDADGGSWLSRPTVHVSSGPQGPARSVAINAVAHLKLSFKSVPISPEALRPRTPFPPAISTTATLGRSLAAISRYLMVTSGRTPTLTTLVASCAAAGHETKTKTITATKGETRDMGRPLRTNGAVNRSSRCRDAF